MIFSLKFINYYLTIFLRPYASRERGIEDEKPEKYRKELTVNTARAKKTTKIPTEYHKIFSRFCGCCFSIKKSRLEEDERKINTETIPTR